MSKSTSTLPTPRTLPRRRSRRQRIPRMCLLLGLVLIGTVLLSGCSYPGDTSLCTGPDAVNCTVNAGVITNPIPAAPWYLQWFYGGIDSFLGFLCNQSVGIGITLFWKIFSTLAQLNFVQGGDARILAANAAEAVVAGIAYTLIPAVLMWQIFRNYGIATLFESTRESITTSGFKILIAALVTLSLPQVMTFVFGLSNAIFVGIIGDTASLHDLAESTMTGINQIISVVKDPGLMTVMVLLCLVLGLIWLLLGLVFLARTVLVFILYCLAPLAILAATTDDVRPWFDRWFEEMLNLVAAPIPVAVCIKLVITFADVNKLKTLDAANLDTFGDYLVQLIFILFFMLIGVVLMGKIGGKVSGSMYGLGGYAFKQAIRAAMVSTGGGGAIAGAGGAGAGGGAGSAAGVLDSDSASGLSATPGGTGGALSGGISFGGGPRGESPGGASVPGWSAQQGQETLVRGLRSVNETLQDNTYGSAGRGGSSRGGYGPGEADSFAPSVPQAVYHGGDWQSEATPAQRESAAPIGPVPRREGPAIQGEFFSPAPSAPTVYAPAPESSVAHAPQSYITGAVADPFGRHRGSAFAQEDENDAA